MATALLLQIVSVATYFSSTVAFEMLSLSNQYTAAITDMERFTSLAAGQGMLTTWQGTAFDVSYILGAIALLTVSYVILRSNLFGKFTAWIGILTSVLMFIPPSAGMDVKTNAFQIHHVKMESMILFKTNAFHVLMIQSYYMAIKLLRTG